MKYIISELCYAILMLKLLNLYIFFCEIVLIVQVIVLVIICDVPNLNVNYKRVIILYHIMNKLINQYIKSMH